MNEHTDRQMDRQAEENTKKQLVTGRQMGWQMNKQTERWKNVKIDGQADRQVGKQTVCLSDGWTYWYRKCEQAERQRNEWMN
jgi:hypothetical protein